MKPSKKSHFLTLLAILFMGMALSASRLKLPAFSQSAGAATQARPAVGGDEADDPANADRSVFVQTDKMDYAPGEAIIVNGGGWDPGEAVTLLLHEEPTIHPDRKVTVIADASGNIFDNQFMQDAHERGVMLQLTARGRNSGLSTQAAFGNPAANLDQWANLNNAWVNGNLGSSKAEYFEGDSIPYRLAFTSLDPTKLHQVTIQWDTLKGGKHALDYITTFNRSVLHTSPPVPGETPILPCAGVTGSSCTSSYVAVAIPFNSDAPAAQIPGEFRLFGNGGVTTDLAVSGYTIDTTNADHPTSITVSFRTSVANPVLTWGGHIATRVDWGSLNSAVTIPGSPYHTRLLDLDGSGGNQDRSLSADAVTFPGSITIIKDAVPNDPTSFSFTATGGLSTPFSLVDNGTPGTNTKAYSPIVTFQTYTISETTVSGWTLSFANSGPCTVTSPNGGSSSASGSTVTINLKEGENYTCTFTNTRQNATLIVKKHVINDNGGTASAGDFTMSVTGASPSPASFSGSEAGTSVSITPNTAYTVGETPVSGYTESGQNSATCNSATGIAPGGSATCTITNTSQQAHLTIIKHVDNTNGGTALASAWTMDVTAGHPSSNHFAGSESPGTTISVDAGSYSVDESGGPSGYTKSLGSGCSGTLAPGGSASCTITNTAGKASPALATTMSWTLKDTARLSGIRPGGSGGTGVTFNLYGPFVPATFDPNADNCSGTPLFTDLNVALVEDPDHPGDATYAIASTQHDVSATGIYLWTANYSGDSFNNPQSKGCGSERTDIAATYNP